MAGGNSDQEELYQEAQKRSDAIWRGVELLAEQYQLSLSGLARAAGLDPTAFNPSKRRSSGLRPRWLSTESVDRALKAIGSNWQEFAGLVEGAKGPASIALWQTSLSAAQQKDAFGPDGLPQGVNWQKVAFPDLTDRSSFLLTIDRDQDRPVLEIGYRVLVSPAASLHRGDMVAFSLIRNGESLAAEAGQTSLQFARLQKQTIYRLEVTSLTRAKIADYAMTDIAWLSRVSWLGV